MKLLQRWQAAKFSTQMLMVITGLLLFIAIGLAYAEIENLQKEFCEWTNRKWYMNETRCVSAEQCYAEKSCLPSYNNFPALTIPQSRNVVI